MGSTAGGRKADAAAALGAWNQPWNEDDGALQSVVGGGGGAGGLSHALSCGSSSGGRSFLSRPGLDPRLIKRAESNAPVMRSVWGAPVVLCLALCGGRPVSMRCVCARARVVVHVCSEHFGRPTWVGS